MKIRITEEIPTAIKPKVGEVYEVTRTERRKGRGCGGGYVYFIKVDGKEVGGLGREMKIVEK